MKLLFIAICLCLSFCYINDSKKRIYPSVILDNNFEQKFDSSKWIIYKLNWKRDTLLYGQRDSIELITCPLELVHFKNEGDTSDLTIFFKDNSTSYWIKSSKQFHFHTITYLNDSIFTIGFSDGAYANAQHFLKEEIEQDFVSYIYKRRNKLNQWLYDELKMRYKHKLTFD